MKPVVEPGAFELMVGTQLPSDDGPLVLSVREK